MSEATRQRYRMATGSMDAPKAESNKFAKGGKVGKPMAKSPKSPKGGMRGKSRC